MDNKKYTITDISEMLGVSRATVSRAINGAPGVSAEVRNKILRFVDEVGYHPNTVARGLSMGKLNIIALILGDIRNPFYAELAFNIQQILKDHHYMVMVFNSEYDDKRELEFIQIAEQFNFAGLILLTAQCSDIDARLQQLDMPKVLVNRILPSYRGDSVLIDNFQAGYEAAMHLIQLGHREIGFIAGQANSSAANQRFQGYRQALTNYSLPFCEDFYFQSDLKLETGCAIGREFASLASRPSAMVVVNDMTSIGFISACKENGIRVPEDLSVVSFDNIPLSNIHDLQITTMNQHLDQMSCEAARLILKQLEHPEAKTERIILKPTLVVRKTTGPCP